MKTFGFGAVAVVVLLAPVVVPARGAAPQIQPSPAAAVTTGVREAAWSPDGKRIAVSWFDAIWTMTPDGKDAKRLVASPRGWAVERDPVWVPPKMTSRWPATS